MSFKAVSIINGEVYDGMITSIEEEHHDSVNGIVVQEPFKGEINLATGQSKSLIKGQVTAGDLRLSSDNGVLSTASNNGTPVRDLDSINDKTIVKFNGVEMTAKMACQVGLLRKDAHGRYSERKKSDGFSIPSEDFEAHDESLTEVTEATPKMSDDLYDHQVEQSFEALSQELGGYGRLDNHALSALRGLVDNDITHSAKQLAAATGYEPEQASNYITKVAERLKTKAANYISKAHGVDGDDVIQWVSDNIPSSERASMAYEVYLGQTGVLDRMADQYKGRKK